tara:strand:- start:122 stop:361 length:240 start_codon:yes stop_codon:yes gene_type:complete
MTRPFLGPDMTYNEQRKCRMQDAIDDYLSDENTSPRQTYDEMLDCIDYTIKYHENAYVRARELRDLMMGYREVRIPKRY